MDKTPLQQVKQMLENDVTPKAVISWIESTGLGMQREMAVDMWVQGNSDGWDMTTDWPEDGEQYYRTKYGETDH